MHAAFITSGPLVAQRAQLFATSARRLPSHSHSRHHVAAHRATRMSTESPPGSRGAKVLAGPFDGKFGTWYLTQGDADGVLLYRACMLTMALAAALGTALATTGGGAGMPVAGGVYDGLGAVFALSFGGALMSIHIYVRVLHNALKVLWAAGAAGGLVLAASPLVQGGVVQAVFDKPELLLAVGWMFVALTGVFVKEAVCFARLEALALIALLPVLTGGHFLHALSAPTERSGAVVFSVLFVVFALRKFMQPAADDLGDLSVFTYLDNGGQL